MLNTIFDKIYCINLERRTDRQEKCRGLFEKLGLIVEFFPAVDGSLIQNPTRLKAGEYGAALSHVSAIRRAKELGLNNVLVLEDDIELPDDFNEKFAEYYKFVPENWEMLYCGANHERPCKIINEHCAKCLYSFTLHFVGIKSSVFDSIVTLEDKIAKPIDVHYAMLQQFYNAYVTIPHIAFQSAGYSDIQQSFVDYEVIRQHEKR